MVELTEKEIKDISRALVIAMQQLDATKNSQDIQLANRLEIIHTKIIKGNQ